jgi:hypothetical protein
MVPSPAPPAAMTAAAATEAATAPAASEELDWAELEADAAAPVPEEDILDPFNEPAAPAVVPGLLDDPFADDAPTPRKRYVPDDDDPFA